MDENYRKYGNYGWCKGVFDFRLLGNDVTDLMDTKGRVDVVYGVDGVNRHGLARTNLGVKRERPRRPLTDQ